MVEFISDLDLHNLSTIDYKVYEQIYRILEYSYEKKNAFLIPYDVN